MARAGPGPLGGSAVASSAGATFRWAGVGGGQHQSCDRPQLLPRGLSRALGPGFSRRGEKGHCTRLAFHSKGTLFPAGPRVLAHEAGPRLVLSELLPGSQAGRARTRTPPMDTHAALGLAAPGTGLLARGSVCGGRCQHGTSEQLQYSSRSRQRLAPRTSAAQRAPRRGHRAQGGARLVLHVFRSQAQPDTGRGPPEHHRGRSGSKGSQGPSGEQGYLRSS